MQELPLVERPTAATERADAASNRRRILTVAARLFQERGADHVSMQDVAREACVGMGTMYRRFGDRAGLTEELLSEETRGFQDEMLRGAPPLGPGAPPRERLHAWGRGQLQLLEGHAVWLAAAGKGPGMGGPDGFYRMHLGILLREAAPQIDVEYAVLSLMAALDARLYLHLREDLGWSLERVQDGWCAQVDGWLGVDR
ncbi:TetR/AcrR family transcriptional regulator [Conexibacter sp. CPCC 206217]|uniref:TetR/AcrR family transcriptional regulator n=1 Tax=Conexibacter sp. CPCC 206217 TaxID=3064574 RepID=UPI0027242674|nr:TetR/AcrR family transcriptional regulator [Conexibacter sp. CPCC 206217]MDO8209896.1 helix-turn-helix domain-containing protein [Conexibacter sp. CPCC 206217]